jgi:hypothetical protein
MSKCLLVRSYAQLQQSIAPEVDVSTRRGGGGGGGGLGLGHTHTMGSSLKSKIGSARKSGTGALLACGRS